MIILDRKYPKKLMVLEALLRRLSTEEEYHFYHQMYLRTKIGYEGELRVDQEWQDFKIHENYYLFHNYETVNEQNKTHQIDTLFICTNFILLLEIKNISGHIEFEHDKHQFIRTNSEGVIVSFNNPIDQVERHAYFLRRILLSKNIKLPVEVAIVIANSSTIIGEKPKNYLVFHVSGLRTKLLELYRKYPTPSISNKELKSIKSYLLRKYSQKEWKFAINKNILKKGALCSNCNYKNQMKYDRRWFRCERCQFMSREVIYDSLNDYQLLINNWITNKEFREFFGIESVNTANKLLKWTKLQYEGINRGRKYFIPDHILSLKPSLTNKQTSLTNN